MQGANCQALPTPNDGGGGRIHDYDGRYINKVRANAMPAHNGGRALRGGCGGGTSHARHGRIPFGLASTDYFFL